jgi:hypothetical protein
MEAPFDVEGLGKDLAAFRDSVRFYLTDDRPIPPDLAEPLRQACDTVVATLDELSRRYNFNEDGFTIYAPEASPPKL